MKTGRPAAQPPKGWSAAAVSEHGLTIPFTSEDGSQHAVYDFGSLAGSEEIKLQLASSFAAAVGPLGTIRRVRSADGLRDVARRIAKWLNDARPNLRSLAELTPADVTMICLSLRLPSGDSRSYQFQMLLRRSPVPLQPGVFEKFTLFHKRSQPDPPQPYTAAEFHRITTVLRGIVRRAKDRLHHHYRLIAAYRSGAMDDYATKSPQLVLAEVLDHCLRTGSLPKVGRARPIPTARAALAYRVGGRPLHSLLHLSSGEAWAFGVLIAATTGLNRSVIAGLPARHHLATGTGEPGIAMVEIFKPRRGARARMTIPIDDIPSQLRTAAADPRPGHVVDSSLTTAYGLFRLLVELTEAGRSLLGTNSAFVFYNQKPRPAGRMVLTAGLPTACDDIRRRWVSPWLTGDGQQDELLVGIGFNRMRKTYLEQHRKPVSHTPATLTGYLSRMETVQVESFQIVREALDEQVRAAVSRRAMTIGSAEDLAGGEDTALSLCVDLQSSPLDGGGPCRRGFLDCLDCSNARALPRHLPTQLAVLDELHARRRAMTAHRWAYEYAGRAAQLEDLLSGYEPVQIERARGQVTEDHSHLARQLLDGMFDLL